MVSFLERFLSCSELNIVLFIPQYSLYSKKESAHEESIWCCAWKRYEPTEADIPQDENGENTGENKENEEDPSKKTPPEPRECVVTGGVDDIVRVWNYGDSGELRLRNKLTDHSLGVVAVDVNKEVTRAVSSSLDSTIHLWDLSTGERIRKIDNGPMESWTVAFSPDGKHIMSGAQNGKVHFFDVETGQKQQQMDTRGKFLLSIAYVSLVFHTLVTWFPEVAEIRSKWHKRRVCDSFLWTGMGHFHPNIFRYPKIVVCGLGNFFCMLLSSVNRAL